MHELKFLDASEDKPLTNSPLLENEESFIKKKKIYFIIAAIIVVIALVVVLCVCLIKPSSGNKDEEPSDEPIIDRFDEAIKLEVYSGQDNKEIFFLSEDFKLSQTNLRNLEENHILYVDGKKYPFAKSMKLKKGKYKVELLLNETSKFTCENMFKGCKDISSIHFNITLDCNDNMENMFSGCTSLLSIDL